MLFQCLHSRGKCLLLRRRRPRRIYVNQQLLAYNEGAHEFYVDRHAGNPRSLNTRVNKHCAVFRVELA